VLEDIHQALETAQNTGEEFSLEDQIASIRKVKRWLLVAAAPARLRPLVRSGVRRHRSGRDGAIFLYLQENNTGSRKSPARDGRQHARGRQAPS